MKPSFGGSVVYWGILRGGRKRSKFLTGGESSPLPLPQQGKACKNCLVKTFVLVQLKLQSWQICYTKWFQSASLGNNISGHVTQATKDINATQNCSPRKNLVLMWPKLEAWQKCYTKLLSENLSANVAQKAIMVKMLHKSYL